MNFRRIRLVPIAMALMGTGYGHAAGIGDISVMSSIGQPLRAEIQLLASPDERLRESCFRFAPAQDPDDDIPTLTRGHISLRARAGQSHLLITTSEPVSHPVLRLSLRAGCDIGMTREFTLLMPTPAELPVAAASAMPSNTDSSSRTAAIVGEWQTIEGESIQSIAKALYPGDRHAQQRFTRAAIDANRALFEGQPYAAQQPLPEGLRLKIPSLQTNVTAMAAAPRAARESRPDAPPRPKRAARTERRQTSPTSPGTLADQPHPLLERMRTQQAETDRLQIGVAPPTAGKSGAEQPQRPTREQQLVTQLEDQVAAYQAVIDKINKMEAYAEELKGELDRMDVELAAATAAAQGLPGSVAASAPVVAQQATRPTMAIETISPPRPPEGDFVIPDWLLGTLAGGTAIGMMAFLSRRRIVKRPTLDNPTLPMPDQNAQSDPLSALPEGESWTALRSSSANPGSNVLPFTPRDEEGTIDVSEHESAMELAEIMLSFGRIKGAAQVLSDYLESNPRSSVEPWLKLLELYREAGMRQEFEVGAERLNRLYNVSVLKWDDKFGDGGLQSLERFAHIRDRLVTSWGTADCLEYLKRLLEDNRNGSRSGFTLPVLDEILLLVSILEEQKSAAQLERVGRAA